MNRIRNYNGSYQVLITPFHTFDSGFELLLGNWTDEYLRDYSIKTFKNMSEALSEAFNYPDINWVQLVDFHKDIYVKLYEIVKYELLSNGFIVDFEPKIMSPIQLKQIMFDRVNYYGKRFQLKYNLNDVIGYHIISPYQNTLIRIAQVMSGNKNLRIIGSEKEYGITRLIGKTDIGTTYEIILWPTMIAHWAKWCDAHQEVPTETKNNAFKEATISQTQIDKNIGTR